MAAYYLLKILLVGIGAVVCLACLVSYPSLPTLLFCVLLEGLLIWFAERDGCNKKELISPFGRAVLITGCDTGFGNSLAKYLDTLVFAGCLDVSCSNATELASVTSSRLSVVQLNVRKMDEVLAARTLIEKHSKTGLWAIVNNAGLNFLGPFELTTMEQYEKVTDVNLLGMVRVCKTFLPLLRKSKGRIVNVTSVKGRVSMPYNAAYCMTKWAAETLTDSLRMEMEAFGIKTSIIEPGNFGGATGCLNMDRIAADFDSMWNAADEEQRKTYGSEFVFHGVKAAEAAKPTASFNIQPVLHAMTAAILSTKPKKRYLIQGGRGLMDNYLPVVYLHPFLPSWLMDKWMWSREMGGFPPPQALARKS